MIFNSIEFIIFLPIVFALYWGVFKKTSQLQNGFLLISSYVFYGWWDWRFLVLIILSTTVDFFIAKCLKFKEKKRYRKRFLIFSLVLNLGMLIYFKYCNFFIESWIEAWRTIGVTMHFNTLQIVLPVGISFYTFQTLSYTIDVYRKKIEPTNNYIEFAAYVSFFPQLVAGPIERATSLLPQFTKIREFSFSKAQYGIQLIIWGLFKKVVIADSCATYANHIFNNYENYNSVTLILGAIYFAFQIYGDFSGYSDIAVGTAKLFGFDLMRNFKYPYFSRDIAEFWRRWHISLSTWFRDYLYIPLGGSKVSKWKQVRNVFVIFIVSGFWHGANWTFIVWGTLNAMFFLPLLLLNKNRKHIEQVSQDKCYPALKEFLQMLFTFVLTTLAWIFFRAENLKHALDYIKQILAFDVQFKIEYLSFERYALELMPLLFVFIGFEWIYRHVENPLKGKYHCIKTGATILAILTWGVFSEHSKFIYFQF